MFFFLFLPVALAVCNANDKAIFALRGQDFPTLFRQFGGLTVGQDAYVAKIQKAVGLSLECSVCYGKAYMCGWSHCKWDCLTAGDACDACLTKHKCNTECDKCTEYNGKK
jgi:hypothetical protein